MFVLAGATDGRQNLGAELVATGVSKISVVSNLLGETDKAGLVHCQGNRRSKSAKSVLCVVPQPVTSTGEALTLNQLAKQEKWSSVIAVTNRPHARRVRSTF